MAIIKKREIEVMAQLSGEKLKRHLNKLPATKTQFEDLFNYLQLKLQVQTCDHTSRFTMQFMMQNMMNFPKVSGWLSQNGGYCDCTILKEIAIPWWILFENQE